MDIAQSANQARAASIQMAAVKSKTKNRALSGIIESLIKHTSAIESANSADMNAPKLRIWPAHCSKDFALMKERFRKPVRA